MKRVEDEYPMGLQRVIQRWTESKVLREIYIRWYQLLIDHIDSIKDKKILEVGCGCGFFAAYLEEVGVGNYRGVDHIFEVVKVARDRNERGRFLVGNAEQLPLRETIQFDVVFCIDVLHHLDYNKAFMEMWRVLKPGGVIGLIEPGATFVGKNIGSLFHHEDVRKYPDSNHLTRAMQNCGFAIEECRFSDALAYPLSGGFSRQELIPFGWKTIFWLDRILSHVNFLCWKLLIIARKAGSG